MPDVFISYSRRDLDFVQKLDAALIARGKTVWFDQKREPLVGILPGEKWWEQIKEGIQAADNFLFIISQASMASPYCNAEVAYALAQEKRIVTILHLGEHKETETLSNISGAIDAISPDSELPTSVSAIVTNLRSLTRRNWLEISQIQYVSFSTDGMFDRSFDLLIRALDTDLAWIKLWSQLQQAAQIWAETGDNSYLWSEMRLKPVHEEVERRGQPLSNIEQKFLQTEQERLMAEIENINTPHLRRSTIGERLAAIGDMRPGVGLRGDGLPDIAWCEVPGGQIELEDNQSIFTVQPFYIAKYPITFIQFQAFLNDPAGFEKAAWWEELHEESLKQKTSGQRTKVANYSCDSVSWSQAVAFCRWLNVKLPKDGWPYGNISMGDNWQIRLPTEWEWQQAATGGDPENNYPWGNEWDSRRSNTMEAGVGRVTGVGMYPQGISPVGALDMSGNVWEWCLNEMFNPENTGWGGSAARVMRGGSYNNPSRCARCGFRGIPFGFDSGIVHGFRVCCSASPI